jgi:hypothetical protein
MPINWTEPCPGLFMDRVRDACAFVFGVTTTLTTEPADGPERQARWESGYALVLARAEEAAARVRGNRPDGSPISKGDARLIFINALRTSLELLEAD